MLLTEAVVDVEPRRLRGENERMCCPTASGGWGGFVFGAIFVAAGTPIVLVGLKVIPVDPSTVHAPYLVIALLGGLFAVAGMAVWAMALKARRMHKKQKALITRHPDTQAFKDYPWDPNGVTKSPWAAVWKSVWGTFFFAAFLTPFNWWAWLSKDGTVMVKVIVSLFDAFLVLVAIELVRRIMVAVKYGPSKIEYDTFPCTLGSCMELKWVPPSGLEEATKITFLLRAVEEWTETHGSGKNRTSHLIHEQRWAATRETEGRPSCRAGRPMEITFDIPADAPGAELSAELRGRYWELEVKAEAPGVDFSERYLVPLYARS